MIRYYFPIFVLFVGCKQSVVSNPVCDKNDALSTDTIQEIAIREVQSVNEDPSISYEAFDSERTDEYDFSWVPSESEYFSIVEDDDEIIFSSETLTNVSISCRLETSITIQGEGPHCDLVNWKHGATTWEDLILTSVDTSNGSEVSRFKFKIHPFERTTQLPFPLSDMMEIKDAVKKSCGEGWANHMLKSKSPYDYPCNVSISSYIFRVKYELHKNEEQKYKYLKIPVAMGC